MTHFTERCGLNAARRVKSGILQRSMMPVGGGRVEVDVDADMERAAIAGKGVGGSADLGVDDSSAAFSGGPFGGPFLDSGERGVEHPVELR
ncbi:hypothetical protein [Streptomyces sp. NPDC015345]|uniref:hypothetical protein n=1 Tax=Streptomyces sp. NPDC015345 TaxID=3364953 RepID=UPI0036FF625B